MNSLVTDPNKGTNQKGKEMNVKTMITAIAILATSASIAAPIGGPGSGGNLPWRASADIVGTGGASGIVIVTATYAECSTNLANSMAYNIANNGVTFENIQGCHYLPPVHNGGNGLYLEYNVSAMAQLSEAVRQLERKHQIHKFTQSVEKVTQKILRKKNRREYY